MPGVGVELLPRGLDAAERRRAQARRTCVKGGCTARGAAWGELRGAPAGAASSSRIAASAAVATGAPRGNRHRNRYNAPRATDDMQRTTRTERRAACLPPGHAPPCDSRQPMPQPTAAHHGATENSGGAVQLPRAVLPALVPVRRVRRRADQRQAHRRRRRARPRRLRVRTAARVARGTRATGSRTAHGCAHTTMRAILAVRGSGAVRRNALRVCNGFAYG